MHVKYVYIVLVDRPITNESVHMQCDRHKKKIEKITHRPSFPSTDALNFHPPDGIQKRILSIDE